MEHGIVHRTQPVPFNLQQSSSSYFILPISLDPESANGSIYLTWGLIPLNMGMRSRIPTTDSKRLNVTTNARQDLNTIQPNQSTKNHVNTGKWITTHREEIFAMHSPWNSLLPTVSCPAYDIMWEINWFWVWIKTRELDTTVTNHHLRPVSFYYRYELGNIAINSPKFSSLALHYRTHTTKRSRDQEILTTRHLRLSRITLQPQYLTKFTITGKTYKENRKKRQWLINHPFCLI